MPSLAALLNAPARGSVGARAPAPPSAGGFLDGILQRIDQVEETQGALSGEFYRAFIEGQFRQRNIPLNLKSRAERELEARQSMLASKQLQDLERKRQVNETVGFLLDNANTTVEEALGRPGDTRTLQDFFGTRLDASLLERPEDIVRASQIISQELGTPQLQLHHSDLLLSELTGTAAKQSPEERGAQQLARQTAAQRDYGDNVEFQQTLQAGESPAAQALTQRLEGIGAGLGQDLSPAGGLGDDDFDEPQGSAGVLKGFLDQAEVFQNSSLGADSILSMFLTEPGRRVKAVLDGAADTQIDDQGRRILVVDRGDSEAEAAMAYVALIDKLSEQTGIPRRRFLEIMGMEFDDLSEQDVGESRAAFLQGQ